jgi:hypothetical protein
MKKSTYSKIITEIKDLEENYNFNDDLENYIDITDLIQCENVGEVIEYLRGLNDDYNITDAEVIYYASAIAYLAKEDQSLTESLEIANECWFKLDKLNSETLASLLMSRRNLDDYAEFLELLEEKLNDVF